MTHDQTSLLADSSGLLYSDSTYTSCVNSSATANFISADDCGRFGGIGYVIQYNFTALHVAPLFQSLADEALVREATSDPDFKIDSAIAPLVITKREESFGEAQDTYNAWLLVVFSFPFIGGAFASFVVAERESKAKHLQTGKYMNV